MDVARAARLCLLPRCEWHVLRHPPRALACLLSALCLAASPGLSLNIDPSVGGPPPPAGDAATFETIVGSELVGRLAELASHTDGGRSRRENATALTRTLFSPAHKSAAALIQEWMRDAGMQHVAQDGLGNIRGRYDARACPSQADGSGDFSSHECSVQNAIMIGSHYDTVIDGGVFDGALGVLAGIAAVKLLNRRGVETTVPIDVVAFSDEEGVRFHSAFLGSRAMVGTLATDRQSTAKLFNFVDSSGVSLGDLILGESEDPRSPEADQDELLERLQGILQSATSAVPAAYVELHIEQGPELESRNQALGVVTAIVALRRYSLMITGQQGHAGTVKMKSRRDALAAAAEIISAIESRCKNDSDQQTDSGNLVCTTGSLEVSPGASNVIPGKVRATLDVRTTHDETLEKACRDIEDIIKKICTSRLVECDLVLSSSQKAVEMDAMLVSELKDAVRETVPAQENDISVTELSSGAGHDAMTMAANHVPSAMLFVRCEGGHSHTPEEFVSPEDVETAARALFAFLHRKATTDSNL